MTSHNLNSADNIYDKDIKNIDEKETVSNNEPKLTDKEIANLKRTAKKIELAAGYWFDDGVNLLLENWKKWINCYIDFNWTKLYSVDTKSIDDAYLQHFWKTKLEFEKEREKRRQEEEARKQKRHLEVLEKAPTWIEEWKKYIDESKWEDWEKNVNRSINDLYEWMDAEATLVLLKMIDEWKSWREIQKTFDDQWHSWMSYHFVRNCVVYFSKKWEEANRKLDK